jgi:3-oxoacid CoA-transferase
VAEVEQLVEVGELDPDQIIRRASMSTASSRARSFEKRIEFRTLAGRDRQEGLADPRADGEAAARRSCATATTSTSGSASRRLVSNYIPEGSQRHLQSENGLARHRAVPGREPGRSGPHQRGKQTVTTDPGLELLLQRRLLRDDPRRTRRPLDPRRARVAENGDLANWMVPGKMVKGPAAPWTWSRA